MMAGLRKPSGNDGNNDRTKAPVRADLLSDIRAEIVAYLSSHPGAADNVTGIKRWWLPANHADVSSADVATVLAALVAEGLLQTRRLPGDHVIFAGVGKHDPRN